LQGALDLAPLLVKTARMQGIYVGSRTMLERFCAFVVDKRLIPVIDRVFGFDQVVEAYQHLAAARHFGKVIIKA
jgi:NADPH:quinone reductase-like Zn-dependent oxidoreductase